MYVYNSCRCSEISSTPKYVLDNKCKELSTAVDQTAQRCRANERGDIFRQFSGSISCCNMVHLIHILTNVSASVMD